ncbi:MAG: VPS10 domain-containing protein [Vulcanimicrobiaceae bacterium]
MRRLFSYAFLLALCGPLTASAASPASAAAGLNPNLFAGLHWRLIGPFRGGRALAVTGVPGRPNTFYFGAVGGGVWKTGNAGRTWRPVFDREPVASIGAIAVAPSSPSVVYVGSGEADMRSDIQAGDGMYRSTDAGKSWERIGLRETRQIGAIVVDPQDAKTLYVAALGNQYAPNAERGVFKSTNGGKTWTKVLYENADTGAVDLSMDPSNPEILFAALWQTRRPPWNVYPPSSGPGSGLYKTTDGGKTWARVAGHGFPAKAGRIGISISPADTRRIYAVVDTNDPATGGIYRSDDGGTTWQRTDGEQRVWKRGWYFGGITADPKNPNEVYVMDTSTYRSTDGGVTFVAIKGAPGGDDYHTLWIDPSQPSHMILGGDQGVVISLDDAKTWSSWYNQPTGQFYHIATDNRFPFWVYGSQQDSGAAMVPSRSPHAAIGNRDWSPIDVGGEDGYLAPDPLHPHLVYGDGLGNVGADVTVENVKTGWERNVDPTIDYPGTVWRSDWTMPLVFSPTDPHVLYFADQRIFRTADGGKRWSLISPDLTRRTDTVPRTLDPATVADNTGLKRRGVIYALAPSPVRAHEIWAGTDDGLVWITRDGGKHWKNVTPRQLTPWSKVGIIDASPFDANSAYAAVDRHRLNDDRPYIYRTHDGGRHWKLVTDGIPNGSFVNVVREDPEHRGLLYAGTERGVYVSFDDGGRWQPLQLNLPIASVRDIAFRDHDIVVATHGRALWVLDDASPLRQLDAAVARSDAYLFKPVAAYLIPPGSDQGTPLPPEEPQAKNPPDGAILDYYVKHARTPLVLTIDDASGHLVRRWSSAQKPVVPNPKNYDIPAHWLHATYPPSASPGEHRFVWNLHYGSDGGVLAPPGRYTVTMTVDGRRFVQPLTVRRDPLFPATDAALRSQFEFAQRIDTALQRVTRARTAAAKLRSKVARNAALKARLIAIAGVVPPANPDNSVGVASHDFSSLRYLSGMLGYLESVVEGGAGAPTPNDYAAYAKVRGTMRRTLNALASLERSVHTR